MQKHRDETRDGGYLLEALHVVVTAGEAYDNAKESRTTLGQKQNGVVGGCSPIGEVARG